MSITYNLVKNNFGTKEGFVAKCKNTLTYDTVGIAKKIHDRGSTLTLVDIHAVLMGLKEVVKDVILEGGRINLDDFLSIYPSISGKFDSLLDSFDSSKHTVNVKSSITTKFKKEIRAVVVAEKVDSIDRVPKIKQIVDLSTGAADTSATIQNIIKIYGKNLAFDTGQTDEGVFLVSTNGTEEKINYLDKPSGTVLNVLVPQTTMTEFYVEVRSRLNTQTLRKGRTQNTLMAA